MCAVHIMCFISFFFSSRRRHTRCALVTGVQTCALPICATPLIEQPLLANYNGRVEAILVRGMTVPDIRANPILKGKLTGGDLKQLTPGSSKVAIGIRLAENLGAQVGSRISIINPAGRATPFGTVPREISYEVAAIFEVGVYDYDKIGRAHV